MSLLNVRKLNARMTLGWALVKHIASRPFVGRRLPGPWLDTLAREDLAEVPDRAWELFGPSGRCIGCGVCDCVGRPDEMPSRWILSLARLPSDAPLVQTQIDRLSELAESIERVCPARLPVTSLVALVRANASMLDHQ